jgi:hypothetical protein
VYEKPAQPSKVPPAHWQRSHVLGFGQGIESGQADQASSCAVKCPHMVSMTKLRPFLENGSLTTLGQLDQGQAISGSWFFDHTWST